MGEMVIKAGWKMPGLFKGIDPDEAYREIYGDGKGHSLSEIVEIARDEDSVIHDYFEWDDEVASEEYRKIQAGRMVRNFVLTKVENEDTKPVKTEFRLVEADSSRKNVYTPIKFFMQNKDEYARLLERAKIELDGIRRRYSNLIELETIIADIEELLSA